MFKIAVCDDEKYCRQVIKELVKKYMEKHMVLCEIDVFHSGKEFLELGIEMAGYNVVFLDINMDEIDGIITAKQLRRVSKEVFIVFVTAYINYTLEGYKVDAVRYLLKSADNFEGTINECMDAIIEKKNYYVIKKEFLFHEGKKQIPLDRILFIESRLHKLEFYIMEQEMKVYTMYNTLNEVEEYLSGDGFIRIHQSYLVNLRHIKKIINYKAILDNGKDLVIPKARYKYVKDMFITYKGEL